MYSQDDDPLCFMYVDNQMTHLFVRNRRPTVIHV